MVDENIKNELEEWMKNAEKVGNVYNVRGSRYSLNEVPITIEKGKEIPNWSYVFVKHWKTRNPVVFQIIDVYFDQHGAEYQDVSISMGSPIKDPSMRKYKCRGLIVGEIEENGDIIPPRYPIEPEADVYLCPDDMVEFVTQPLDEWSIRIGEIPELRIPVKIQLEQLIRQGLLITGAQGTGKTTALITLIVRAALANPPLRFLILDWTGEFKAVSKGLYKELAKEEEIKGGFKGEDEIKESVEKLVKVIDWWKIYCGLFTIKEMRAFCEKFLIGVVSFIASGKQAVQNCLAQAVETKARIATAIAKKIWEVGSYDPEFGCIIVVDEAHRVCPEKDFGYMDPIWQRLASEGGRNKIPLWIVARRLSLVSKKVTTELQQNFFCFNVEDVDRKRVEEDLGKSFASIAPYGTIPTLHCIIKSNGFKIPGQVVFTKVDVIERPAGARLSKDVFEEMGEEREVRGKRE